MSIHDRLNKIEKSLVGEPDGEEIFSRYCTGPYDPNVDFYENLRRAGFPPHAIPEPIPMPELPDRIG